jgi:hypothetical protein
MASGTASEDVVEGSVGIDGEVAAVGEVGSVSAVAVA